MEYFEVEQKLTSGRRMEVIRLTFIKKMDQIYQPHKHLTENNAKEVYMGEIVDILNSKMPTDLTQDHMVQLLKKVWTKATMRHTSRFYFSLADITKAATEVASEHHKQWVAPFQPKVKYSDQKHQAEAVRDKSDPRTLGWDIPKVKQRIAEMEQDIADKRVSYKLGQSFLGMLNTTLNRPVEIEKAEFQEL